MTCKVCKKYQHACGDCGLRDWEYDFCSEPCKLKYFEQNKDKIKLFWDSLSKDQQNSFDKIAADEYCLESLVSGYFIDKGNDSNEKS